MSNAYYNATGTPAQGSQATTPILRSEFAAIQAGFDKLPSPSGNAYKLLMINASGTAIDVTNTLNSLTLTACTYNGLTINTTTGTLTLANGKSFTCNNSLTLVGVDGKTLTVSNSLTLAGTDGSTLNVGAGGTLGSAAYQNSSAFQAAGSYQTVAGMSSYATVANPAFTGDMTLSGGANRIRGDFSNGTVASRAMFQTSNLNTPTYIGAIPNGTGGDSRWTAWSDSDPTNASYAELGVNTASAITFVGSGKSGTGTHLPLTFWTSGSRALDLQTDGNISFGLYNPVAGANRNLYIANTDTTAGSAAQLQLANGAVGAVYYVGHIYGGALLGTYTNHDLVFQRNASEVARLTSLHKIKSLATAKAWVNFNGTTGAIYAAFNVSSVTRNAVGDYTANITAGVLADANFAWSSGGDGSISSGTSLENEVSRSSTSLRLQVVRAGAMADPTRMSIIIFGN